MPDAPINLDIGSQTASVAPINITREVNSASTNFAGWTDTVTATAGSSIRHRTMDVGGVRVFDDFYYLPTAIPYARMRSPTWPSHSIGMKVAGSGTGALESDEMEVIRWGWEGTPGQVSVIGGMGSNRLSVESQSSIVHIAGNSRYEIEGYGAPWNLLLSYEAGSSAGKPLLFSNRGQSSYADSVVQIGVDSTSHKGLQVGTFDGTTFAPNAEIDGTGTYTGLAYASQGASGTARTFTAKQTGDSYDRFSMGVGADNKAFIGMGAGTAALDTYIRRGGAGIKVQNASAAYLAIQGKLTTDANAVSETITPTHTLTLFDASGVPYKIACVPA